MSPLPTSLEDALKEIRVLHRMLEKANERIAAKWMDKAMGTRSLKAELKRTKRALDLVTLAYDGLLKRL